jgi:hypothetical protein
MMATGMMPMTNELRKHRRAPLVSLLLAALLPACQAPPEVALRKEITDLRDTLKKKDDQLVAQKASIDQLESQLEVARGLSDEDLKHIFYPEKLEIEPLSGGENYDNKPGDDGVTVYLRPVDKDGDALKVAGDIRIQLYDLAAAPEKNLIGEYFIPVDQVGKLWHGKLWTYHYAIKCPFPDGPPEHTEVTIRAVFVDYLTKRVVSAQSTCQIKLPP